MCGCSNEIVKVVKNGMIYVWLQQQDGKVVKHGMGD